MSNIIKKLIDDVVGEKYLSYAVSTIVSRSLPDVRDGFKPVHRRIIYSMYQLKLLNDSPYKKCARIVGDVMGKFHPHGDQAIYDSLVRLAQDFSTRAPFIDGQGNFGNIDGDNAAAMRYTEARLDPLANFFFDGIEENAVDFKENYDGQNYEPVVLPSKLPNILLNGSSGIAVGMATNIPPHNIFELNDAIVQILKNPDVSLKKLLNKISGPDFPTGGEVILSDNEQKEIYKKGRGSFIIRSKWHIENLKNGQYQIVISEIPYQLNKTRLIEQIASLINNKKLPLDDVFDESDEKIRIVLKPRNRNIDSKKLIDLCFKISDLSVRFSCNFNVLIDGTTPKQLGLKDILNLFIKYRLLTIKRKSKFNIDKINDKIEILNGYLIVYKFLDSIIKIIRTKDDPKKTIMKKYKLNENQVNAILNMRLGSLKKLDEYETKNEIIKLKAELKLLNKLIKDKVFIKNYLIKEIEDTNKNLLDKKHLRKTSILLDDIQNTDVSFDEFDQLEKMTIIVDKDGMLKSYKDHLDIQKFKSSQKDISDIYHIMSNQKLLLFVSSGRVFTINPNLIPSGKARSKNFIYFIDCNINDKLIKLIPSTSELQCIVASLKGKGFIADLTNIETTQKKGKQLFNLKNNDKLINVYIRNKDYLACVTNKGKLLIIEIKDLPILQKGVGVQLQKIKNDNFLSDIQLLNLNEGISWKTGSFNKNEKNIDFWIGKRSQSGKKVPKRFNKKFKFYEK